ncbi:hypothetical protein HYU17_00285 [Candidatus Woesearchaeota archaeon]|nr:hypothetical protein [Candidatus Woesearchaeota archaeon]
MRAKKQLFGCALKREIDSTGLRMIRMNLRELYQEIRERQPIPSEQLRAGMRVGILYPDSTHIMTIGAIGHGRIENYSLGQQLVAVAKIALGQPAVKWEQDGTVHLINLQDVTDCSGYRDFVANGDYIMVDFPGCSPHELLEPKLGVLWPYTKAVWEPVGKLPFVQVSKEEKRAIWRESPLEKLVDDNTSGAATAQNRWFYAQQSRKTFK